MQKDGDSRKERHCGGYGGKQVVTEVDTYKLSSMNPSPFRAMSAALFTRRRCTMTTSTATLQRTAKGAQRSEEAEEVKRLVISLFGLGITSSQLHATAAVLTQSRLSYRRRDETSPSAAGNFGCLSSGDRGQAGSTINAPIATMAPVARVNVDEPVLTVDRAMGPEMAATPPSSPICCRSISGCCR
jgi:hypothetical protein